MALVGYYTAVRRRLLIGAADRQARAGKLGDALQRLAQAGGETSDPDTRRAALQHAAALAERYGEASQSLEFLRDIVRLDDRSVEAWERLVARLEAQGLLSEAIYGLRRLAGLTGDDQVIPLRVAALTELTGDSAARRVAWEEVLVGQPDSPLALRNLAQLTQADEPAVAQGYLARLLALEPSEATARALAILADRRGDVDGAVAAWRKVLGFDPIALDAHRRLATLLEPISAREALPHLRYLGKTGGEADKRRLAEAFEALGDTDKAIAFWRVIAQANPAAIDARVHLADLLEQADPKEALQQLNSAARRVRHDPELFKRVGRLASTLSDDALAAEAWAAAARLAPGDLEAARSAAGALLKVARPADAVAVLRRYTRVLPAEQKVRRSLLGLVRRVDDQQTELELLRELHALNAETREFAEPLGLRLLAAEQPWEAVPYLEMAALAEPDSREAWTRYAEALEVIDRKPAALEAWKHIASRWPNDVELLERVLQSLDGLDRRQDGVAVLETLAQLTARDRKAWLRLAARAREFGDTAAEIVAWEQLARLKPADAGARRRLVELYFSVRRRLDALPHVETLSVLAPDDPAVWRSLVELREAAGDTEGVTSALQKLVAVDSTAIFAHERLAKLLDARGDRAAATPHLKAFAEGSPESEKAWRRFADRLESLGDLAEAADPLAHLHRLVPDDLAVRDRLAAALVAAGRPEEAAPHYWAVADAFPKDAERLRRLITFLKGLGRTDEVIEASRRLLALGGDQGTHADLAAIFLQRGENDEALPHLRAVARESGKAADWRRVAKLAETMDAPHRAIDAWRRTVALDEGDLGAHDSLARLYMSGGDERSAAAHLIRLADAKPDNKAILKRLVDAQEAIADWAGMALTLDRLARLQPQHRPTLRRRATALLKAGKPAEALEGFRQLDTDGDNDLETLAGLALAAVEVGEPDLAIEALARRLARTSDDLEGFQRITSLLYLRSRRAEALPYLRQIVRLDPTDVRSLRRIASIVAAEGGDVPEQVQAWRDVLAVNPDDAGAHEQIVELLEIQDIEAALPHMEAVARLTPDKVKPWKRLGKWLQDLDRNEEAIAAWSESLAIAPDDVETQRRLAQLYLLAGDYRAGLRHLDAFGRLNEEVSPSTAALVPEPRLSAATPLVSAVILSLDGAELLESLFSSFHATNTYPAVELIVVDHGSRDGTAGVLDAWQDRLPIRRIMRDANYSYSASCNLGVAEAKGDLVLLLNNDVVFHEDVLVDMVRHLTPDVGIVGLKQYNSAPLPEEVLRPYHIGVRFLWDAAEGWFKPKHVIPTASDMVLAQRAAYFPGVTASVMLCRKADYLAVGGLDEAYVYGHEDMDFCCKMRMDHGRRIVSLNSRSAFHRKNSTRRAEDFAALQAQRAANEALFRQRWEARIAEECLARRFTDDGSWRGWPPRVGLGLPAGADDATAAALLALGEALTARCGWQVRYLIEGDAAATDGRGLDAILAEARFPIAEVGMDGSHPVRVVLGGQNETVPNGFDVALPVADAHADALADAVSALLRTASTHPGTPA